MTDRTHPEAGSAHIIRYALELGLLWVDGSGRGKVREALDALDALEAKLASIGAGGVQALSAAQANPLTISPLEEQQMFDDWCPYRGNPDPRTVWAAAIEAVNGMQLCAASPTPPAEQQAANAAPAWADQAVIEYRYTGGTHWCPLGPAERMKPDFDGVYRLQAGVYPVEQVAPKAAPGEREQAAQRLRELAGISQDDVADPLHPRYIEGYKAGHAAGRKRAAHAVPGVQWQCRQQASGFAAPQQEAQEPAADVQAKIGCNTWDHFGDILPTLKAISRGDWYWGANTRCKYIEIRIDTRDGGCILYDSKRVRISPQQFAHQSHDLGKMVPWPAKNALGDTTPQPAPAPLSDDVVKDAARYRWLIDQHWIQTEVDWRLISTDQDSTIKQLDAAIDAAIAAQGGK